MSPQTITIPLITLTTPTPLPSPLLPSFSLSSHLSTHLSPPSPASSPQTPTLIHYIYICTHTFTSGFRSCSRETQTFETLPSKRVRRPWLCPECEHEKRIRWWQVSRKWRKFRTPQPEKWVFCPEEEGKGEEKGKGQGKKGGEGGK